MSNLRKAFAMETWPVSACSMESLKHVMDMKYNIYPLLAFDIHDKVLPPSRYESKLMGVVVEVHFAFVHYYIASTVTLLYYATLNYLNVLP
jgi:hypothetical protein